MAAGDSKLAQEYPLQAGKGAYNNSSDTFRIFFCSNTYASVDATQTPFNLSDVTQVGGGNFPIAGVVLSSVTWTRSGAVYKVVDLTADGSTAIDVVTNDFDYTVNASGSVTGTVV